MMAVKKISEDYKRQRSRIIARLFIRCISTIRPEDYGVGQISAALDRLMVLSAVEKCESEDGTCTAARIAKDVRMPDKTVRRALNDLVSGGLLERIDRRFATRPIAHELKIDAMVNAVMSAARELTELDGHRLVVGNAGPRSKRVDGQF